MNRINKSFITKKINNKITIFDGQKSVLFSLNESASLIYEELKKGKSDEQIIELLLSRFNVPESILKQDYQACIKVLKENELLI